MNEPDRAHRGTDQAELGGECLLHALALYATGVLVHLLRATTTTHPSQPRERVYR